MRGVDDDEDEEVMMMRWGCKFTTESPNNEEVDSFCANDSESDSEQEVNSALEIMDKIRPTYK